MRRKYIWIQVIFILLLSAAPAFCQTGPEEDGITNEEYVIYRLVIKKQGESSSVGGETLTDMCVDFDALIPPAWIRLSSGIKRDFCKKNLKTHKLSDSFVQEMAKGSIGKLEGRKKISFSRVGFDRKVRHALLVIGVAWYYPEDVMNEGKYVFLEKKNGKWTVVATSRAWPMRLGPIR